MDKITNKYLQSLQSIYYDIGNRGIRVNVDKLKEGRAKIDSLITKHLSVASTQWNCKVYIGAENASSSDLSAVNLNSTSGERSFLNKLKSLGYNVPKITKKNEEGEYEQKYSTAELALQKMLAENQFKHPTGDPAIRAVLAIRELGKLKSGYFNSRLIRRTSESKEGFDYFFLSTYNVAGTITGRRSSKRHTFGYGNNAQNFPKHSDSARLFRECLIPREGNIFLFVDQVMAEEWPVSALSANILALQELRDGVDRHSKLASSIFDIPVPAKTSPEWDSSKHDKMRYLGKKTKHARNYGMKEQRMSDSLAQEGFSVSKDTCKILLSKAAEVDPSVDSVFHKYIETQISDYHMLKTPFGRERMFLGARPNANNSSLFNEAYAYIPQSIVGDNTGFAVSFIEENKGNTSLLIQEGHDSIVQETRFDNLTQALDRTIQAFKRRIIFHNGIEVEIPISAGIGYDFKDEVDLETLDESGIKKALDKLNEKKEKERIKAQEVETTISAA
jgi:hypothetical protein